MVNRKAQDIREILMNKVQSIPEDLLQELYRYVLLLEKTPDKKQRIMMFSGAWNDMKESDFQDLLSMTEERRKSSRRRNQDSSI